MKRKLDKEQFFTTPENVDKCLSYLNFEDYDLIIEPSAGNGSFSNKINNCVAYDIEPLGNNIIKQDFLQLNINKEDRKILVVGNPPFGRQSSLAIKFLNKAATFADTIAFILPLSFKKESVLNKLDRHLFLTNVYDLVNFNFYFEEKFFSVPCAFFIFEVKEELRELKEKEKTEDFSFVKQEEADDAIRRVGFYSGKIEDKNSNTSSHYFVKWNNPKAKEIFSSIEFTFENTVGARSLSQQEMIHFYLEKKADLN